MSNIKTPYPTAKRITYRELERGRHELDKLGIKLRIVEPGMSENYWMPNARGYTNNVMEAGVFKVDECISLSSSLLFELVEPLKPKPPDESKVKPILISQRRAKQFESEIGDKMCYWVSTTDWQAGQYAKRPLGSGVTWKKEEAQQFKVSTLLRDKWGSPLELELVDQEAAARIAALPLKLCDLAELLPQSLIEAIKAFPTHPVYRSLILAKAKKMPPDELTEFEAIKNWIEFNCEVKPKA